MNIAQSAIAPMVAYVGTYTGNGGGAQRPVAEQKYGNGIKALRLDPATGTLALIQELPTLGNPAFQAIDPTQRYLVSVHGGDVSRISSYAIDAGGKLSFISDQSSNGTNPAFISISPDGHWVLIANYTGGSIAAYPIDDAGRLGEATDVVKHTGGPGPHPNQNAPHPHQIVWDPDGRYVFVCDLGLDKVFSYKVSQDGKLAANDPPFAELPPGSGPRHLAFHPNGPYAYVVNELKSTLAVCNYDATKGVLTPTQVVSTLSPDFKGNSAAAEVIVAPSGQFVYTATRWADVLTTYAIDQSTGQVTPIDWVPAGVRTPRAFSMDPTGSYVYAMGLDSDTINTFTVDAATGRLRETGQVVQANSPVCMTFSKV
jgi:6-phosphogluconolactonase (cycloisomerase 2 family)